MDASTASLKMWKDLVFVIQFTQLKMYRKPVIFVNVTKHTATGIPSHPYIYICITYSMVFGVLSNNPWHLVFRCENFDLQGGTWISYLSQSSYESLRRRKCLVLSDQIFWCSGFYLYVNVLEQCAYRKLIKTTVNKFGYLEL